MLSVDVWWCACSLGHSPCASIPVTLCSPQLAAAILHIYFVFMDCNCSSSNCCSVDKTNNINDIWKTYIRWIGSCIFPFFLQRSVSNNEDFFNSFDKVRIYLLVARRCPMHIEAVMTVKKIWGWFCFPLSSPARWKKLPSVYQDWSGHPLPPCTEAEREREERAQQQQWFASEDHSLQSTWIVRKSEAGWIIGIACIPKVKTHLCTVWITASASEPPWMHACTIHYK